MTRTGFEGALWYSVRNPMGAYWYLPGSNFQRSALLLMVKDQSQIENHGSLLLMI